MRFTIVTFYIKQATAVLLLGLIIIAFALPVFAADAPIFGSVRTSGPAWVDMGTGTWATIESERPLIAGDSLKTGDGGYAVLDLGDKGALGMYKHTEIAAAGHGKAAYIDVLEGKLAFHMARHSDITIAAASAELFALSDPGARAVDGFVEFTEGGETIVGVEEGVLGIIVAGTEKTISAGERFSLTEALEAAMNAEPKYYGAAPVQLAANFDDEEVARMAAKRAQESKQAAQAQRAQQAAQAQKLAQAEQMKQAEQMEQARRIAEKQAQADKLAQAKQAAAAVPEQAAPQQIASVKNSRRKPSTAGQSVEEHGRLTFESEVAPIEDDDQYGGAVLIAGMEAQPVVVGSVGFIAAALAVASFEGDTNGSP